MISGLIPWACGCPASFGTQAAKGPSGMAPITVVSEEGEVCADKVGAPPGVKLSSTWEMVSFMLLPLSSEIKAQLTTEIPS